MSEGGVKSLREVIGEALLCTDTKQTARSAYISNAIRFGITDKDK